MKGTFKDSSNLDIPYFMGCYGIGISRILSAIAENNCDEAGIKWPEKIAPYPVTIIYTNSKREEAFKLYDYMLKAGIDAVIDDRSSIRVGTKIKDWKLFGIPYMIIIGDKAREEYFEVESRENGRKFELSKEAFVDFFK